MTPSQWKRTKLGEVASFKNGLNFKKSDKGEAIKVIGVGDFESRSALQSTESICLVNVEKKVTSDQLLRDGDLLFVRSNGNKNLIGRCLFFPTVEERLAFSGFTIRGRVNKKYLMPVFASYLCRAGFVKAQFSRTGGGTNISNLSQSALNDVKFDLPPMEEQAGIANILLAWDSAIETTENLIKISQAQKKALMQQLLTGKRRLPGFKASWKTYKFSQVFNRLRRKNDSGNQNVLTISGKDGLVSQRDFFSKRVASINLENYSLLLKGDFAYNKSYSKGYPFGAIKPLTRYESGVVSNLYICFALKSQHNYNHDFFRHFFESGHFDREIYAIAQEGARNHGLLNVSSTDFFNTRLCIPEAEEQAAIAAVINSAEADLENQCEQLSNLQRQKKALMQQLLTGKRRVKIA